MITDILKQAREASATLSLLSDHLTSKVLMQVAEAIDANTRYILNANKEDLFRMDQEDPKYDRLMLTAERIAGITADMRAVAALPSPLGRTLESRTRPNGMQIDKVSVPFGVVGVIYEARPNVTADVFGLCFKSGNVAVLKGGHEADASNRAIVDVIRDVLVLNGIPREVCTLLPTGRESSSEMLTADGLIDVIIPRGSASLINYVRQNATVPIIETGAGVCHTYFDSDGNTSMGKEIVYNAKTRRVSVCNALDCLLIARDRLADLPEICKRLADNNVIIYADEESFAALAGKYPSDLLQKASADDYGREWLDYKMSIRTVSGVEEAIEHIARYGSGHSECIITRDQEVARQFTSRVDAACVYVNVSTAFTDGAQFGLGAEIGISTQKLHARGPMGLAELTTYKYIVTGNGQVRW
ncbi:MAG: glutamate-5-semialdehyde dehydrogenase [Bacteroidales bacterium]|nr:glutamate-5-semialdehyde dehydrogenase [Bacteroidales bacterium]